MNLYSIVVDNQAGEPVSLSSYEGQVLLIVNTATGCGFTPQYEGLEALYQSYKEQGFAVLDFPCNQFGNQAPGSAEEINSFCSLHYQTSFPRFAKIEVNGAGESPLYSYLKKEQGGLLGSQIKWNFTKFLVDRKGKVVKRYAPTHAPADIKQDIERLLHE